MRRWNGMVAAAVLAGTVLAADAGLAADTAPRALALSAAGNLLVGNSTRVADAGGAPAPVASGGAILLDERCRVGDVHAATGLTARLLARVDGDVDVAGGGVQLGPQAHVTGDVAGEQTVVVGVSARVDGAVVSRRGGVTVGRLGAVRGDVFAQRDWRGDRDIVVGAPGTVLAVKGRTSVRDRSEYFAEIDHEGPIAFLGVGDPILHAAVRKVPAGTLHAPAADGFGLARVALAAVTPGSEDRTVAGRARGGTPLPPGSYGTVVLQQGAVVRLTAGTYAFARLVAASDARFVADLGATPAPLRILIAGDAVLGRRVRLDLVGDDAAARAALVLTTTGGAFRLDQDGVWAGTVLGAGNVTFGKHVGLAGAAWSGGQLAIGRDGDVTWVPSGLDW